MKIEIVGSVASGKTTLSKELSLLYGINCYQKDNIVWERLKTGDRKRSQKEQNKILNEIINKKSWILEGTPRKTLHRGYDEADIIVILEIPLVIRLYRVSKRWIKQRFSLEEYNTYPTVKFLLNNYKWALMYHRDKILIKDTLEKNKSKIRKFRNKNSVLKYFESVKNVYN